MYCHKEKYLLYINALMALSRSLIYRQAERSQKIQILSHACPANAISLKKLVFFRGLLTLQTVLTAASAAYDSRSSRSCARSYYGSKDDAVVRR